MLSRIKVFPLCSNCGVAFEIEISLAFFNLAFNVVGSIILFLPLTIFKSEIASAFFRFSGSIEREIAKRHAIIEGVDAKKAIAAEKEAQIKAVQKDNFVFLITPGITYALLFFDAEESTMTTLFGIGSEFSANFLLAKHFYLKLNIDFRYYLLADPNGNGLARENGVSIQPGIAAGFYF